MMNAIEQSEQIKKPDYDVRVDHVRVDHVKRNRSYDMTQQIVANEELKGSVVKISFKTWPQTWAVFEKLNQLIRLNFLEG